jgi:hypothetical protein
MKMYTDMTMDEKAYWLLSHHWECCDEGDGNRTVYQVNPNGDIDGWYLTYQEGEYTGKDWYEGDYRIDCYDEKGKLTYHLNLKEEVFEEYHDDGTVSRYEAPDGEVRWDRKIEAK